METPTLEETPSVCTPALKTDNPKTIGKPTRSCMEEQSSEPSTSSKLKVLVFNVGIVYWIMSLLCLQYGQCGNQVGSELFKTIYEDIGPPSFTPSNYIRELDEKWFNISNCGARKGRSVLIDTEEKVVSGLKFNSENSWSYDPSLVVTSKTGGSGNNWALGYYGNGLELVDEVLDSIDRSLENCDYEIDGFISILGLGGGTGSGLSCFISQALSDRYPKVTRVCLSMLPFSDGDVCTQPYNTLLSLSKLYDSQHAIVLFSNDYIFKICTQVLRIKSVKMSDMNRVIAEQLASCFSVGKVSQLMDHLTRHPSYKLVTVRSTPLIPTAYSVFETTPSWSSLVDHLKMSLVKSDLNYHLQPVSRSAGSSKQRSYRYYKCVSNMLTCRGPNYLDARVSTKEHPLNDISIYPSWLPSPHEFLFGGNNKKFINKDRFASLMTNSGYPHMLLEPVAERAWTLFSHEAYLHHYSKYGLTNKEFLASFGYFKNILDNYSMLM